MISRIFLILCISLSAHGLTYSQGEVEQRLRRIKMEFESLNLEKQKEYIKLDEKARKAFTEGKIFTCLRTISLAEAIFKDDVQRIYLKGLCYAELHDVDAAILYYKQVLKIHPRHIPTLMNLIEINFFDKRFKEVLFWIKKIDALIDNQSEKSQRLPLLEFKRLISLAKLAKLDAKYKVELKKQYELYSYLDDTPYYYFSNALKSLDAGKKDEGLIWILKAYLVLRDPRVKDSSTINAWKMQMEAWNKALVDTGYIEAYEIMFHSQEGEMRF